MRAMTKYVNDNNTASQNYSWAFNYGTSFDRDVASDKLYLDELEAEADFWGSANDWLSIVNAGVWAGVTYKVGLDFAASSPVVQAKVAGVMAMLAGGSALAVTKIIGERTEHYKNLAAKQRAAYDEKVKYLLWQQDYGGNGQPNPFGWDDLFPGCQYQTTCIPAWVCTPRNGRSDCERQDVCDTRIVKC